MTIANLPTIRACRPAWNKGRVIVQKRPLLPKYVWAIRVRLEIAENHRDLALFNLAIDSKLRGRDLVKLKVSDVYASGQVKERASVIQSKTQRSVRFEITERTRKSLARWMDEPLMVAQNFCGPDGFMSACTYRRANTPASFGTGRVPLGWMPRPTARIRCAGPRLHKSTRRPGTCVPCSSCSVTPRWTAPSAISGLSLKMRSQSRRQWRSERYGPVGRGRP